MNDGTQETTPPYFKEDISAFKSDGSDTAAFEGKALGSEISFFYVNAKPAANVADHFHPYSETWLVEDGEVVFRVAGETINAQTGAIVVVPAFVHHGFENASGKPLRMICIHASPEFITTWA